MGTTIKHPVPDRVWASESPDVKNYKWRLNPVWHKMLSSCTHVATVGFKGLMPEHTLSLHLIIVLPIPCDATQSIVLLRQVVRPSVCLW